MTKESRVPTDLQILSLIYDLYYPEFAAFDEANPSRTSKVYVPIDSTKIAKALDVDVDLIFGRLLYHLQQKYGYKKDDGTLVPFFYFELPSGERHLVHFPLLAAVLADLLYEDKRHQRATRISYAALGLSLISITVTLATKFLS